MQKIKNLLMELLIGCSIYTITSSKNRINNSFEQLESFFFVALAIPIGNDNNEVAMLIDRIGVPRSSLFLGITFITKLFSQLKNL